MTTHDYRDVLLKAASIVEEGWCQGDYTNLRPGYLSNDEWNQATERCALGAIYTAQWQLVGQAITHEFDVACIEAVESVVGEPVDEWNDAPGRTVDEVAAALRQAATA